MSHSQRVLLINANIATLDERREGLGIVESGVILIVGQDIAFVGSKTDAYPGNGFAPDRVIDLQGRWVTPGLIDCHTHIIYGGHRANEFEMRLSGATHEEIPRAGAGIVSSVKATNAATVEELVQTALPRLDTLLAEGLTTIAIKSGYGLNIVGELKMLRVARQLTKIRPIRIATSYLGAHATPIEYKGRNFEYLKEVVLPGLYEAHAEGLVDAVDGFCEAIAFSVEEMRLVFEHAKKLNLRVKLHAEQLSNLGGAKLAAAYQALSADHLEYLDQEGAEAMARADTVGVILPGVFYAINETRKPPVKQLRESGVRLAVATDANPGTSPLTSILLAMNMTATLFGLTVHECIAGTTREAARALGLLSETGTIEVGKSADLAIWNIETPAELVYRIGFNPLHERFFKGQRIARCPSY